MSILLKPKQNFTMVQNDLLNSTEVSAMAKLLYIYLISKPNRWNFTIVSICSQMKESKNTINRYLQELEDLRLLLRRKIVTKEGRFEGIVYYVANLIDSTIHQKTITQDVVNISKTDLSYIKGKGDLKPKITLDQRLDDFKDAVRYCKNKRSDFNNDQARAFFAYWTEMNPNGKQFRKEMEKVFDIDRRVTTWIKNNFGAPKTNNKQVSATVTKNS